MRRWRCNPISTPGLDRLTNEAARSRVCLMCAEREPLDCHRCLLVARRLAERGLAVGHILHDGTIEPHAATERAAACVEARTATCSRLDTANESRQRIVTGRTRSRFGQKVQAERRSEEEMMFAGSLVCGRARHRALRLGLLLARGSLRRWRRTPARWTRSRCRRSNIPICRRRRRKNCCARNQARSRSPRARSAFMRRAASPAPWRCRSTAPTWQVMRLSRNRNWGHPKLDRFSRTPGAEGEEGRVERPAGRRHVAAARRSDAHRPRQPSGRPRRRHLVDADA